VSLSQIRQGLKKRGRDAVIGVDASVMPVVTRVTTLCLHFQLCVVVIRHEEFSAENVDVLIRDLRTKSGSYNPIGLHPLYTATGLLALTMASPNN
jgi:hypothetical protein